MNFSFALVALISARVINWQKSRLQIQTDLIRNLYMIEGFIMVLLCTYPCSTKTVCDTFMDNGGTALFFNEHPSQKCKIQVYGSGNNDLCSYFIFLLLIWPGSRLFTGCWLYCSLQQFQSAFQSTILTGLRNQIVESVQPGNQDIPVQFIISI